MEVKTETVNSCPICGNAESSSVPEQPTPPFGLRSCEGCGLIFLSPRPSAAEMAEHYADFYDKEGGEQPRPNKRQQRRAHRHFRRVQRLCPQATRLLEVGAGDGYFLHTAREAGLKVAGVELSAPRVARAKEWFDIELFAGDVHHAPFPTGSFEVAAMFQLLEHLHDPDAVLRRVRTLLKPGGMLIVSTPNALAYARKKRSVDTWRIPRHLFFFTPRTLVRLVESCGFRPIETKIRLQATAEEKFAWQPWRNSGPLSELTRDLLTPFGLRLAAVRTD